MSTETVKKEMAIEDATKFFSEFYGGEHHIPGDVKKFGSSGWAINHDRGGMATYDFDQLTRLVLMAHRDRIRVELLPSSPRHIKIAIWQRQTEGGMSRFHPDIFWAISKFNQQ